MFAVVPRFDLKFLVSAFQSEIFNRIVAKRLEVGIFLILVSRFLHPTGSNAV
jgi:tRNA pseudouridine13 synthase